ncbi:MAG: M4 family metallopeptidase [Bacteroidetes bacterium]|nr:M4 family metallopeptidase [Bacteroidota bacterium]
MKKQILSLFVLALATQGFSQNNFRQVITGEKGVSRQYTALAPAQQISFNAKSAASFFRLDQNSDLVLERTETDRLGYTHYRYSQTYMNIPIENSMYITHIKAGKIISAGGSIVTDFDPLMQQRSFSKLSAKQAVDAAVNYVHAAKYMWQDPQMEQRIKDETGNSNASYQPKASLVWYNPGDILSPREMRLAYKVDVYAMQPLSRAYYFIDAQSGQVLGQKDEIHTSDVTGTANTLYSGTQTIHSDSYNGSYRLRDYSRGNGIITKKGDVGGNPDYTSSSSNWSLSGKDRNAMDAHWGVEMTYDFYKVNFNRNSVDGNGYALTSYVNQSGTTDNAYWDGSSMHYGTRSGSTNGVTGIDVTGHELTHGVTQYTCGLNYSNESGAMNESLSDIMGKSVQFWAKPSDINWLLSNDMNWIIRDMSNPNAQGQPDTYKGTKWYSGSGDNGGVHTNSGVGNFMFYLLVTGGSGTNDKGDSYSVSGIGLSKADQIIYRSQTVYLSSNSKYADWRTACINAATDLYGSGSNEVTQVENAWYAVGIGTAGGGGGSCNIPSSLSSSALTSSSATLSWSNTGAVSYNLQWKNTSAGSWTTVSGISGTSYNLSGLTSCTNYQFQVQSVCSSGSSAYSSAATFQTTGCTGGTYCTSSGYTAFEYIQKIILGSISNVSGDNGGYADYTSLSTNLVAGNTYTFKGKPGFHGSTYMEYWTVYIDYNHDGDFNDANETAASFTTTGKTLTSKTFTVPASASNGATRMRVQMSYGGYSTNPCAILTYGEVEDYTVNISGGSFSGFSSPKEETTNTILVSPNPVTSTFANLAYHIVKDGNIQVKVLNMNGQVLQNIDLGRQSAGSHNYTLNSLGKLASGTYMIVLEQENQVINRTRFVVTR